MKNFRISLTAGVFVLFSSLGLYAQEDMDVKVNGDKVKVEETQTSEDGDVVVETEMKVSEDKAKFTKEMEVGDEEVSIEKKVKIDENEVKIKKKVKVGDEEFKTKERIDLDEYEDAQDGYSKIDVVALPQSVKDAVMNDFDAAKPEAAWIKEEGKMKTYKIALKTEGEAKIVYSDHDGNWLEEDVNEEVEIEVEEEEEIEENPEDDQK
jgi:hypothetical protein